MSASYATSTIKKGAPEPGFDKTAQRILNLFFVLNSSPEPLTTEQIVLDSDLGYGSGNIDSDKRKFRRDRDKLLERGILIKEVRRRCAGDRGKLVDNRPRAHVCCRRPHHRRRRRYPTQRHRPDASGRLFHLCRAACRYSLQIAYLTGRTTVDEVPIRRSPTVDAVWSAFAERCALRFLYQNGRGEQKERTVCVYGMFEREGGRTSAASTMSPTTSEHSAATVSFAHGAFEAYAIPADFNLNDYLFFEFDFADRPPVAATFSFALRRRSI
ncbi:MAG: hypothetical protein ACLU37_06715 [Collinsella sp.]